MITQRVAELLAYEIHGTAWEKHCQAQGLNPSLATAEDLLGPLVTRMTHDGGKPVLAFDDDRFIEEYEEQEAPLMVFYQDPKSFVTEVTEIAGLTRGEARLVRAIVDGSPIPAGNTGYMKTLATRFRTTPDTIRKTWARAKMKLRQNWATT